MNLITEQSVSRIIRAYEKKEEMVPVNEAALSHITSFVLNLSGDLHKSPVVGKSCTARMQWKDFSKLNDSIQPQFASLSETDQNHLFLGFGPCLAAVVQHFSQFFRTLSPSQSTPFPIAANPIKESGVSFYPINPHDPGLVEKTRAVRFCTAAYKIGNQFKKFKSVIVSEKILSNKNLKVADCLPALPMKDLLKTLNNLESQDKENGRQDKEKTGYLLRIIEKRKEGETEEPQKHAIALHLDSPYHFFDPAFGLATSENKEEFLLFLANFLAKNYPNYSHFGLIQFTSTLNANNVHKTLQP